jgi:stage V sporulation protein K
LSPLRTCFDTTHYAGAQFVVPNSWAFTHLATNAYSKAAIGLKREVTIVNRGGQRTLVVREIEEVIEEYRTGQIAMQEALKRLHATRTPSAGIIRTTTPLEISHSPQVARGDGRIPKKDMTMNRESLSSILEELDSLIGLKQVKKLVKEVYAFVQIQQKRTEFQLKTEPIVLHMVFKGNPGTGKTTVARILARLFREMGVLSKGHLVEVERADLVGEYIGHTAQKTREHVKKALGGILFIDEAYSLARGGEKDFGKEAIDCLVKSMEDHKNDFILILAGYRYEMDAFLRLNPGLPSRLPITLEFEDYSESELMEIAQQMVRLYQYRLDREAEQALRHFLRQQREDRSRDFSNARLVRNIIERAIRLQALRLLDRQELTREDLMLLKAEDLELKEGVS